LRDSGASAGSGSALLTTFAEILCAVSAKHGIMPPTRLLCASKKPRMVRARDEAIWLLRQRPGSTLEAIGEEFGMHHTSVRFAVQRHEARLSALSSGSFPACQRPVP